MQADRRRRIEHSLGTARFREAGTSLEKGDALINVSDCTDRVAAGLNQGFQVSGYIRKDTHRTRLLPHQILDGMVHIHNVDLPFTLGGSQPQISCA